MQRITFLFVLVLVIGLVPALADMNAVGSPEIIGSWQQGFNEAGVTFDQMIIQFVSGPGGPFEFPGFAGLAAGWGVTYFNPTLVQAMGSPLSDMTFGIKFLGDQASPLSFNFWALNENVVRDSALAKWEGSGWAFSQVTSDVPAVPEPGSIVLMGTLLLGVAGLLKRKVA